MTTSDDSNRGGSPASCNGERHDWKERETCPALCASEAALDQCRTELAMRLRQLTSAQAELRQFSHILSHDLKTPMRTLSHLALLLAEDFGKDHADDARSLGLLRSRAREADRLLERMLGLFGTNGCPDTGAERTDVAVLIAEIVHERQGATGHRITIDSELPTFEAERLPLRQVLARLVDNAVRHHDRGCGEVRIAAREQGAYWEFSVADDGPGIPRPVQEHLFDTQSGLVAGRNGLGLALVQRIVWRRGGYIGVESRPPERGCTIRLGWPKQKLSLD